MAISRLRLELLSKSKPRRVGLVMKMHYDTALRTYTSKRVEEIESAYILIGNR